MIRDFVFFPILPLVNFLAIFFAMAQDTSINLKKSHKVKFYVPDQYRAMIDESMDEVSRYFGNEWEHYTGLIKSVLIADGLDSNFFPSHKFLIINKSNQSHMASPVHLASWMVSYFRMAKVQKENHLGPIFWRNHICDFSKTEGDVLRREYLKTR